jgi:hypothetical protein
MLGFALLEVTVWFRLTILIDSKKERERTQFFFGCEQIWNDL